MLLRNLIFFVTLLLSSNLWGQAFIVDPDFAELGNRYYSSIIGIEYEPETDTYMLAGTFAGGEPFTPCLNRINDLGEDDFFWDVDELLENCSGVLNNFFRVPNGYRFGANMIKLNDEGISFNTTIPDFSGTEQIVVNSPRGWADSNGAIYAGSNWRLLEEEGQPETGLLVFTPQGERFEPFPLIRVGHPEFTIAIVDIYEYDDNRLMLDGGFDSLNGHLSIRMARMFKNGVIDTTFSSQLEPHFQAFTLHVDPQGRILVYHRQGGSEETPNDDIEIWRLLPDGSLDPSWNTLDMSISSDDTGGGSARTTLYNEDGSYFIYGRFNFVNGEPRSSICHVDSLGNLLDTFDDLPFTLDEESQPQLAPFPDQPQLFDAVHTPDGGLLIGGRFTHYQGEPYLNLIKLIPDSTVGITNHDFPIKTKIYPNPARDQVRVELSNPRQLQVQAVVISDLSGRTVSTFPWQNNVLNVSGLASGMYMLQVVGATNSILGVQRLVIE